MTNQISIIPELNFWMKRELDNSPVYDTYHKVPVELWNGWREPRSVIELLFNETFDPPPSNSSSSSSSTDIESENDKPYIYLYRRINILNIEDKTLLNRIQPYRWNANIYVANSMNYIDLFDMRDSHLDPNFHNNDTFLPYDIPEEDRSQYITYDNWNASMSSYPLWRNPNVIIDKEKLNPPIIAMPDIFNFSDSTFIMLDKLWLYKTGQSIHINDITYEELDSCLAKLIYIYLDAFLNDIYIYADNTENISDGCDILSSLYEKHVLDILYTLKQKMHGIIWKDSVVVNAEQREINENFFIIMKKEILKIRISNLEIQNSEFILPSINLPWDRRDFTFFKDGIILEQDQDYTVIVDNEDPDNPYIRILLLRDDFLDDELIELIWSYASPYSPFSETDS